MSVKIDWSKITDNVAVNCRTEEEAEAFIEAAFRERGIENKRPWQEHGARWASYGSETCYMFCNYNRLYYSEKDWCKGKGYTILPFSDILIQEPIERNQTAKADKDKLMLELIPPEVTEILGEIFTYGAKKYGVNTWDDVEKERYNGALKRHLMEYDYDNSSTDSESGLPHIYHTAWNAVILAVNEMRGR